MLGGRSSLGRVIGSGVAIWALTLAIGSGFSGRPRIVAANLGHAALFSILACGAFRRARAEPSARTGWRLLGGTGVAGALVGLWFVLQVFQPSTRSATLLVIAPLLLVELLLACGAMLAWPLAPSAGSARVRTGLDGLIFAAASLFAFWALAVEEMSPAGPISPTDALAVGIYVGTAAALGIVIYLARPLRRLRGPLGWIAAAFGLSFVAEAAFAALALAGAWYAAHPVELVALGRWIFLSAAPWAPRFETDAGVAEEDSHFRDALVYTPVALALATGVVRGLTRGTPLTPFAAIILVTLGGGVLLRQFLALRDVRALSRSLERRVEERTRQLEEARLELERTRRLEALGRLASGIAHDFNNMLTAITMNAAGAAQGLGPKHPIRSQVEEIEQVALRGASLTGRLLSFARRKTDGRKEPLELNASVDAVTRFLSRTLGRRYRLRTVLDPGAGSVVAEAGEIDQLLTNLVVNARDAMPEGGLIEVSTERVDVPEAMARAHGVRAGGYARLAVRDSGSGIDDEAREHIFEPFFTTKPEGKGSGLGLASCYGIVSRAGGFITLETAAARGTTFRVHFPVHIAPPS